MWIPVFVKIVPKFEKLEKVYIILSFLLIISTLVLGSAEYGSKNWIYIGSFSFQPSEIVKFLYIFYLASVFRKKIDLKGLIITAAVSGMLVILLVLQKDLGSALIFYMTYLTMLYMATSNEILLFSGIGVLAAGSVFAYRLFSHVRVRVSAWKNPWADIDSGGYQICQSLVCHRHRRTFGKRSYKGNAVEHTCCIQGLYICRNMRGVRYNLCHMLYRCFHTSFYKGNDDSF